jgi:SPP1 gp7 family putative phage head morphogenesis protein
VRFDSEVLGFEAVPSTRAIEFLRSLTGYTRQAFDGLKARYRLTAFTMAGVSDVRVIEEVRDAMANVLENGGTQKDFERAVQQILDRNSIQQLTSAQIDTVFQSNIMRAYGKGRAEQLADPDVVAAMPYWQYRTAGDGRVRPAHAALDGFVAKQSDFVWGRIYPPCGYNCRCTVIPLLASQAPEGSDIPGSQRIPMAAAASVPDAGFGGFTI